MNIPRNLDPPATLDNTFGSQVVGTTAATQIIHLVKLQTIFSAKKNIFKQTQIAYHKFQFKHKRIQRIFENTRLFFVHFFTFCTLLYCAVSEGKFISNFYTQIKNTFSSNFVRQIWLFDSTRCKFNKIIAII